MENHHAINGKTHYFYGHFLCRFLYVYQAGYPVCYPVASPIAPDTKSHALVSSIDQFPQLLWQQLLAAAEHESHWTTVGPIKNTHKKKMGPKHEQKFHCPTKWWTLGGVLSHGGTPSYHPNVHGSFHDKPSSYWGTSIIPANSMGRGWAPQISHGHGERTQAASRKVK